MKQSKRPSVGFGVYILNQNKELLLLKRTSAHGEGTWCPPGGHFEWGETFSQAAKREAKEEVGITIGDVKVMAVTNDFFKRDKKHYFTIAMSAKLKSGKPKIIEKDVHSDIGWFRLNKLPKLFLPNKNFFKSNPDCLCKGSKKFKDCCGK